MDTFDASDASANRCELDSHADTTVAGANMRIMEATHETAQVRPFADEHTAIEDAPIATCGTAYDCPHTGQTFLLVFGQALCFGPRMNHSLICPNQSRSAGSVVDDVPKQFNKNSRHSVTIRDAEIEQTLEIPLNMDGVISYFETRLPTDSEMKHAPRLIATDPCEWDPHSHRFQQEETKAASLFPTLPRDINAAHVEPAEVTISDTNCLHARLLANVGVDKENLDPCGDSARRISVAETLNDHGFCCHATAGIPFGDRCFNCNDARNVSATGTKEKKGPVSAEKLSKMWNVGLATAKQTLKVTTQTGMRSVQHPVRSRFKSQPWMRKPVLQGRWFSDTAFFKVKTLSSDTCAQVTTNGLGCGRFIPLKNKGMASDGLADLINNVGIPQELTTDGSKEQGSKEAWQTSWAKLVKKYHINQTCTEPYSFWQNKAESEIREIKRGIKRFTRAKRSPRRLWDFLGECVTNLRSRTALNVSELQGRTPFERAHACPPELAPHATFEWYDWVCYLDENKETQLGRWLGPAEKFGSGDAHWILPVSCKPIVRGTVWEIPQDEMEDDAVKASEREFFDQKVQEKIGDEIPDADEFRNHFEDCGDLFEEESDPAEEPMEPEARAVEADDFTPEAHDKYLSAEVLLPIDGEHRQGTVKRRVTDDDGNPIGRANQNPLLDTREYEVTFPDGSTEAFSANLIAENLHSQIDDEGRQWALIDEIADHRKNGHAISMQDGWETTKSGQKRRKRTTRGWELLVAWKDGTSTWIPLADMKESYPVETAEYAVGNQLAEEPAFAWWSKDVPRKRHRVIAKAKTRYWKRTHKHGIRLPKTVEEALEIDRETGTDFWQKAIDKEMRNVKVAFEFDENDQVPIGHKEIHCHMVFDVKITLDRKARFVANGNELEDSAPESTFSSVVSRDSVRTFFVLAALNDLEVLSADIQNACLTAPIKEKVCLHALLFMLC